MYVLVLILSVQGFVKVQAFDGLFMDQSSCNQVAVAMQDRLMGTRPSSEASAKTYCFQVPESA